MQPLLRQRHQRNHALIGLTRAVAEGEDAVLMQDETLDGGLAVVDVRCRLGEAEARHHVGHDARAPVVEFGAYGLAVGLVDYTQDGVGMGVID